MVNDPQVMQAYATEQENFWAGDFGDAYIERNQDAPLVAANIAFFTKILEHTHCSALRSVLECGANIGLNLKALHQLLPQACLSAIEINQRAYDFLCQIPYVSAHQGSFLGYKAEQPYDFVFTKGVLIHQSPQVLPQAYAALYENSARFICIAEYYNPTPVEISYRGHEGKLFKRDFAGELMDRYPDLILRSYGFSYGRDPILPNDDLTWFLLEKR